MDAQKMEALGGLVDEIDATGPEAQAAAQAEAQQQADSEQGAREWGVIAFTIGGALSMLAPELRQVYTEDACLNWGRSVVPVAEKYGWNGPANVPELGLLIASAGLAVPSFLAIRERMRQLKEARQAAERERRAKAGEVVEAEVSDGG
jgi:hypothetical protein